MAFPTTSVLDNFNATNEDPLSRGGNWPGVAYSGGTRMRLVSNAATARTTTWCDGYYKTSYAAGQEVYGTTGANQIHELLLRQTSVGAAGHDGYAVEFRVPDDQINFYRTDNNVDTKLGATLSQALNSGDGIGADMSSSTLSAYRYSSSAWSAALTTRTDSTYSAAGYIGLALYDTAIIDNFGGGEIVAASTGQPTNVRTWGVPTGRRSDRPRGYN
jgi:hypothetical protein